jgi:hypothetical protein
LKENAEVRGLILDDIYEKLGLNRTAEAPEDAPEGSAPERPLEEAAQRVF